MFDLIIGFIVVIILFIAEYLLCTKMRNPIWGGIIPIIILLGTVFIFTSGKVSPEAKNIFPFFILNTLFFGDWGTGRDKYKKIKRAELEKMKVKDIEL